MKKDLCGNSFSLVTAGGLCFALNENFAGLRKNKKRRCRGHCQEFGVWLSPSKEALLPDGLIGLQLSFIDEMSHAGC